MSDPRTLTIISPRSIIPSVQGEVQIDEINSPALNENQLAELIAYGVECSWPGKGTVFSHVSSQVSIESIKANLSKTPGQSWNPHENEIYNSGFDYGLSHKSDASDDDG